MFKKCVMNVLLMCIVFLIKEFWWKMIYWVKWMKVELFFNRKWEGKNNLFCEKLRDSFVVISYKYLKYICCNCGFGDLIIGYVLYFFLKIGNVVFV